MKPIPKIILASNSPRRSQLLEWAEIPFGIMVKHVGEEYPADIPLEEVPEMLARLKASAVWDNIQHQNEVHSDFAYSIPVVGADTVVILNNKIYEKPQSRVEAIEFLMELSGKTHKVITGVAIYHKGNLQSFSETTLVTFHTLEDDEIAYYVDKYGPYDKAGAYAIQEWIGVIGIDRIEGDFYNVMGLPISKLIKKLKEL